MVIILCDDFQDAQEAFKSWWRFLHDTPFIENVIVDRHSLRMEMDQDLIYIFIDYRFEKVFNQGEVETISVEDFLGVHGVDDPDPLRSEWRRILGDLYL